MVPPANPKKLRDPILNKLLIEELDDLGIYEDVADFVFQNQEMSIPEIQKAISEKHGFTDLGAADIDFLKRNYYRPRVGNGRGATKGRRKVHKTIDTQVDEILKKDEDE